MRKKQPNDLGERITKYCRVHKLSRMEFCKRFGVPFGSVRQWQSKATYAPSYTAQMLIDRMREAK